ncbi:MAG: nitrilase family protein [Bacteroidetes bacterium]|nr:MAG: nitrilase family protein [Bacteroidota bacterium]
MSDINSKSQETLSVLGIQSPIIWENPNANRKAFEKTISKLIAPNKVPDLIVLPEVFTTGFSMNLEKIDTWEDNMTLEWMKSIARKYNLAITGSISYRFNDGIARNRCLFVKPDGTYEYYDKRHLFTFGGEDKKYERGSIRKVIEFRGWKILVQICYDLRFPTFARNSIRNPYDIILYMANWPQVRRHPWRTLLQARAMENQCYVMGVNRTGDDANNIVYTGDSLAIDAFGNIQHDALNGGSVHLICERTILKKYRAKFPVLYDAD